jgi:hypothetical protein
MIGDQILSKGKGQREVKEKSSAYRITGVERGSGRRQLEACFKDAKALNSPISGPSPPRLPETLPPNAPRISYL